MEFLEKIKNLRPQDLAKFKNSHSQILQKAFDYFAQNKINLANLIKEIQGVKIAYHQSDEISLILTDYDNKNTQGWFDYRTDKMCSVASSLTTFYFMKYSFENNLICMMEEPIAFDARCFNIPEDDAINYFIWRQEDAIRNSIFSFSRQYHSHNES